MKHELTEQERSLLERYGAKFWDLAAGRREPKTAAQTRFVDVVQGRAKAETDCERAFAKALANYAAEERERRSSSGEGDKKIPDHEEGTPMPGVEWFADRFHWRYRP